MRSGATPHGALGGSLGAALLPPGQRPKRERATEETHELCAGQGRGGRAPVDAYHALCALGIARPAGASSRFAADRNGRRCAAGERMSLAPSRRRRRSSGRAAGRALAKWRSGPHRRRGEALRRRARPHVRSHFDAIGVTVHDAPGHDQIVSVLAMTTGGPSRARSGGLEAFEIQGEDGLR